MDFNDYSIDGKTGKREKLKEVKHGIRREQLDVKFHNLFNVYDKNKDGTLEVDELNSIYTGLANFSGNDKILSAPESNSVNSLFKTQIGINNADFMGFVKSVSDASEEIVSTTESVGEDGGKILKTIYKNGLEENIYYYPDGEFKLKTQYLDTSVKENWYEFRGKKYSKQERATFLDNEYKKYQKSLVSSSKEVKGLGMSKELFTEKFLQDNPELILPHNNNTHIHIDNTDLSERAKSEAEVRNYALDYFISTHSEIKEQLKTMGFLDKTGALINAGAGEAWNWIKNNWNGTEEEFNNFYELKEKFESNYNKAVSLKNSLEIMKEHPQNYFDGYTKTYNENLGVKFNQQKAQNFRQVSEQYNKAKSLKEHMKLLEEAIREISYYENEQNAITYAPAQSEGMNPTDHILKASDLLLQYFDNDSEAVDMLMRGTVGNAQNTISAINGLVEDNQKMYANVLDNKSFDDVKTDYESQYKSMYGTDLVPDELEDKIMNAKATGSFVKLGTITVVSILISRSPIMANITKSLAGTAANAEKVAFIEGLVSKFGRPAVQEGIKFAMTSGTLATDVGLTLLNQLTSERGVNGEELWQSAQGAAKYIYFGAYIGAPVAQAVGGALSRIGLSRNLFKGGVVQSQGETAAKTVISGDKFIQNLQSQSKAFMPKLLSKTGSMGTEIGMFSALEVATEGADVAEAFSEQSSFLPKLKIMNHVLEYMLGARSHLSTNLADPKIEAAINASGIKDWIISEHKTSNVTKYTVEAGGIPVGEFSDAGILAAAMMERVSAVIEKSSSKTTPNEPQKQSKSETKAPETVQPKSETIPETENETLKNLKAKKEFYELIKNNPNIPKEALTDLLYNITDESIDVANQIYSRYKKGEIKDENIANILITLTNYSSTRTKEFVQENFDLMMKYQSELWRILPKNIDIVKAAGEKNLPPEELTKIINIARDYGFKYNDLILKQIKQGVSTDNIFMLVFENVMAQKISEPLTYDPSQAYELDPTAAGRPPKSIKPLFSFEGFTDKPQTPEKTIPVPSLEQLRTSLNNGEKVVVKIPNEGGAKPDKGYNKIHPEDISKLGEVEEAGFEIVYGKKRGWSDFTIARDIMQNFYDGNGYTMEDISVEVEKVGDKYKVRVSGDATYDYKYIEVWGGSSKNNNGTSGGHFGEGTKIVAVSLLGKEGTDYVQYGSGEWVKTFNRYDDNVQKPYMTETLTQNAKPVKGNYIEFTTDDISLVKQMIEAKDYFSHPYNKDSQNMAYENDFLAIKKLPEGQKGNIYVVQRYETNNKIDNSIDGYTIVFKRNPNDPELLQNSTNHVEWSNDRDRGSLSNYEITRLLSMFGTTMSREDLAKFVVSLEPIWSKKAADRTQQENAILQGVIDAAEEKILDIDFSSKKYTYLSEAASAEDIEMLHLMGYKPIDIRRLQGLGLNDLVKTEMCKKIPITPSEAQAQQIRLLDEGVRIIQAALPKYSELLLPHEIDAPKFIFNEGGSPNEEAEAIIGYKEYKGHWVKESALHSTEYVDMLATWIHEISHKNGGDTSTEFTNALKKIETTILKTLTEDPSALAQIKTLAGMYDKISKKAVRDAALNDVVSQLDKAGKQEVNTPTFDFESYIGQIKNKVRNLQEYKEYIAQQSFNSTLPKQISSTVDYEPLSQRSTPSLPDIVPTTQSAMSVLEKSGSVRVSVPNAGGAKPANAENPIIHTEHVSILGKPQSAKIDLNLANEVNWSNFKIARDIMQNFYNGNGFTMEGVSVNVEKVNGEYKVKISGLGKYDYIHLMRTGSSTSGNDIGRSAGNYGEGTRIISASLLAKGTPNVKFACGDWQLEFNQDGKRTNLMNRTISKNPEFLNGNYLEFTTKDAGLVEEIINAKDYFYHPYNKNFQNLDFENDYFAFKRLPDDAESNIYLVQKYEKSPDFKESDTKLNIIFKRMPNDPFLVSKNYGEYNLKTGCDRIALKESDVLSLSERYAVTMSDNELIQSIAALEDCWTSKNPTEEIITRPYDTGSMEYTFAKGLINELAYNRRLGVNMGEHKIVGLTSNTPSDVIDYFKQQGYKFTPKNIANSLGILMAKDLYAKEHPVHSIKPTETEAGRLQLIKKAIEVFTEQDTYGLYSNAEIPIYMYDAKEANCPTVHAHIENRKVKGVFIDKNALAKDDFLYLVQESLAQILHTEGNDISANYSYALTDLMSLEFESFIKNPSTAPKLQILKRTYEELGK